MRWLVGVLTLVALCTGTPKPAAACSWSECKTYTDGGGRVLGHGCLSSLNGAYANWTCPEKVDAYVKGTTRPSVTALRTLPD